MTFSNAINSQNGGFQVLNSSNVFLSRSLTNTSNQTSVSNGDGISANPVISLTSTIYSNISFNSGVNSLSIYSTGTYSPTITGSTTNPTVGYAIQLGRYTRIGNRIFININVALNSVSGGSGNVNISLPFTIINISNVRVATSCTIQNITWLAGTYWIGTAGQFNSSFINVTSQRSAILGAIITCDLLTSSTIINASIFYEI